ncbi:O-antigen polymerase [Streptococcus pseudoporcinus]|uniref:Membrane protein n=2 Tax=Streptococcus pseudoporcinus TaxID=361101 RepID=A0A4U9XRG6_9STRE|nr:O-antigen polymerase [Streptococcus pseudoporcinus]VTS15458.1 membrane protein [Streptococcus pseudoporcinus]VUC98538.1 membrane protein [Streptococcus pseudoporcinus]VUC98930.1 membrane protein [Streptococcus pseudoporcinus]
MLFLLLVIFTISLYFSSKWYNNIFNPINIFLGINLLSLILMYGLSGLDSHLSPMIWYIIFVMFISYLIGIFLGSLNYRVLKEKRIRKKETSRKRLLYTIIFYSIIYDISAFVYIWEINKIFGFVGVLSKLTKMNIAFQSGDFSVGIFNIFLPITYALSLMILYYIKFYNNKLLLIIQYILCYIPALSPRRDTLFYLIFMSLVFVFLTSKKKQSTEEIKKYFKFFSILSIAIWFMGMSQNLLNKASSHSFKLFHVPIPSSLNEIIIYIAGNYPYLQRLYELQQLSMDHFLVASLRIYYIYIAPILGIHVNTKVIFDLPLMNIGTDFNFLFNTVPMLYYFLKESGIFFFIGFIILGFITQKLFIMFNKNRSAGTLLLLSYFLFLLFFSFRSYNVIYLSSLLMLFYILIAYFIIDVERSEE